MVNQAAVHVCTNTVFNIPNYIPVSSEGMLSRLEPIPQFLYLRTTYPQLLHLVKAKTRFKFPIQYIIRSRYAEPLPIKIS